MADTNNSCHVDVHIYPHLFLIPAGIIITILAFLNKRKKFRMNILGGRPGLVIPYDFLGFDSNRFSIAAVFGACSTLITEIVMNNITGTNSWAKAFSAIGLCLEVAFLFYPLFACLTTSYKLVGSILGLLYTLTWGIVYFIFIFSSRCQGNIEITAAVVISHIPMILCYLFILGKYILVLFYEGKNGLSWGSWKEENIVGSTLAKPWLVNHVKKLLRPRFEMIEKKWVRFLRLIYSPEKNFRYSVETLSIVVICFIFLFTVLVGSFELGKYFIEANVDLGFLRDRFQCRTVVSKVAGVSIVLSGIVTATLCTSSIVCFMDCHKNNMMRMFKGDKLFIPKGLSTSQFMVGKCLRYAGFQIAYFVSGMSIVIFYCLHILMVCLLSRSGSFFFLVVTILVTFTVIFIFDCSVILESVKELVLAYFVSALFIALLVLLFSMITSVTLFRDRSYPKNVIALKNRKLYLVFSYFFFFLVLPMGFFSAISRILKSMMFGFFMLPRIDRSVFPGGFEKFDKGYAAYISYLHVLAAHRNPVMRVFCQIVSNEIQQPGDKMETNKRCRNKWCLLLTLLHNPQLQALRKHAIAEPTVKFLNTGDVSICMVDS